MEVTATDSAGDSVQTTGFYVADGLIATLNLAGDGAVFSSHGKQLALVAQDVRVVLLKTRKEGAAFALAQQDASRGLVVSCPWIDPTRGPATALRTANLIVAKMEVGVGVVDGWVGLGAAGAPLMNDANEVVGLVSHGVSHAPLCTFVPVTCLAQLLADTTL